MPDQQREREVPKPFVRTVPYIVQDHIAKVMLDRSEMKHMESALDVYIKTLSPEQKQEQRQVIHKQLTDGRLALESLLQRFLSS